VVRGAATNQKVGGSNTPSIDLLHLSTSLFDLQVYLIFGSDPSMILIEVEMVVK